MQLKARSALVTGAARRLGRVIALALAGRGASVAVHYNSSGEEAERTAADVARLQVQSMTVKADLSDESQVAGMIEAVAGKFGGLDVLVNNAGVFFKTPVDSLDAEQWDRTIDSNLKSTFLSCLHAGRRMMAQESGGVIVNIADWAALRPFVDYIPYGVSKAGVVALTQSFAKAFAPKVRVNALGPGLVLAGPDMDEEQGRKLAELAPLKRAGTPADVAATVLFLIEGSDYITGTFLPVDGGRSAV